jgi:glutathione peroxidase
MGQLTQIFSKYSSQGFVVLAVPSNTFHQEPFSNEEVVQYAQNNSYTFPFLAKTNVNFECSLTEKTMDIQCGSASTECCPENAKLYDYLKSKLPGLIAWNYAKFLVGKDGTPIKRYAPTTAPNDIIPDIEAALKA